ncbi:hypothetical protein Tco_1395423, partial [Tanacetum coccineum]
MAVNIKIFALCSLLVFVIFASSVNARSSVEDKKEIQRLIINSTIAERTKEDIAIEKNDKAVDENPEMVASMVN